RVGRHNMAELDDDRRLRRRRSDKGKGCDRGRSQQDFPHSVLPISYWGFLAPRSSWRIHTGERRARLLPLSRAPFCERCCVAICDILSLDLSRGYLRAPRGKSQIPRLYAAGLENDSKIGCTSVNSFQSVQKNKTLLSNAKRGAGAPRFLMLFAAPSRQLAAAVDEGMSRWRFMTILFSAPR